MNIAKCPKCGKEEPYRENSMQICWDCNRIMTLNGLPEPVLKCIRAPIRERGCFAEFNQHTKF